MRSFGRARRDGRHVRRRVPLGRVRCRRYRGGPSGIVAGKEVRMRRILSVGMALLLAACSVETASTAATAAVAKQQEIDQGRETMEQAASRAAASMDTSQDRLRQAEK